SGRTGFGDDRLAARGPGLHAAGEVHRVDALVAQERDRSGRAIAGAADAHDGAVTGDLRGPVGDLAERDVLRTGRMAGVPLDVLADVEQDGVGDLGDPRRVDGGDRVGVGAHRAAGSGSCRAAQAPYPPRMSDTSLKPADRR